MKDLQAIVIQDHTFLESTLGRNSLILDCGGFHGGFCETVVRRFGCTCHVLEPSPENFRHIPDLPGIVKHQLALGVENGEAEFHLSESPICNSLKPLLSTDPIANVKVAVTTLATFLEFHHVARVDLLKLDIEGMEMEVLETVPLEVLHRIDQVTVEFHDPFIHPQAKYRVRMEALIERMKDAGFTLLMPLRPIYFDTLFINAKALSLGRIDLLGLSVKHDHWPRIVRAVRKRLLHPVRRPAAKV